MNPEFSRSNVAEMDFVVGLKLGAAAGLSRACQQLYQQKASEIAERNGGQRPESYDEILDILDGTGLYQWQQFVSRQSQEMMWESIRRAIEPHRDTYLQALAEPNKPGSLGKLVIDADYPVPDWFLQHEIHIQPGGYHSYDLAGPMYDWGGRMYRPGVNESGIEQELVAGYAPADYRRILDMGCGTGRSTIPYKRRYPEAEVWGIDLGEPLLRYAHAKCEELGLAINYALRDTADTRFPDEYFDRVSSHIIFHEMPVETTRATLREAHRILQPRGRIVISDITPFHSVDPFRRFTLRWQDQNNGEPFWTPFLSLNLVEELQAAGFREVEEVGNIRDDRPGGIPYVYTAIK